MVWLVLSEKINVPKEQALGDNEGQTESASYSQSQTESNISVSQDSDTTCLINNIFYYTAECWKQ